MGIKSASSGSSLKRTASLPSPTAFSCCGWFNFVSTNNGGYQAFMGLDDANNFSLLQFFAGTLSIAAFGGYNDFASSPSANEWFFAAISADGTNTNAYWGRPGDSTLVNQSRSSLSFTPTAFYLLSDGFDEYAEARAAYVKIWDATLTQAELLQEFKSARPQRYTNLHLWSPLWRTGDAKDYSGAGKNWTETGSLSDTDMPPIGRGAFVDEQIIPSAASGSDASSTPTLTFAATGASLFAGAASSSPTLTFTATGASLAVGAPSCSPALTFAATGADLTKADAACSPTLTFAATGASLAAGAASSSPTLTIDATSAALKAVTADSTPTLTFAATGASLAAGAPSCSPSMTVDATGTAGASDLASSPTLTFAATSASLFAGAASSSPSMTVDAVGVWLAAAAASSSPTLTFTATGASLFAAAPSCSPSMTVNLTSTTGSGADCTPTLTFAATGKSLAAAAGDCTPTLAFNATGASKAAAAASCSPSMTVNATSGGAGSSRLWRPDYYGLGAPIWRPDYYPAYA